MNNEIVFATKNKGKVIEIGKMLAETDYKVITMTDAGIEMDVEEDGATFEENSLKKAVEVMKASGRVTLSDDSGLEIDALEKQPGVYSARFLGEDTPYAEKNRLILEMLKDVPEAKRTARFVSVVSAAFPDGRTIHTRGESEGRIAEKAAGENGFGYDPIFFLPEFGKTLAEMSLEEKNKISHRGKAMRLMVKRLMEEFAK